MKARIAAIAGVVVLTSHGEVAAQEKSPLDRITESAAGSTCASFNWANRGLAPKAYIRGMALSFAKAACQPERADVKVVSAAANAADANSDALSWYDQIFRANGMANDKGGLETLRHAYVLLIGLGMRESSGKHCVGRDMSANFSTADSAEAGLFQTSWGANKYHPTLSELFDRYNADQKECMLDTYSQRVRCPSADAKNWGEGQGAAWQKLTKVCPAFATDYAAVVIRAHGGGKGEFGPIRRKNVQIRPECDAMLAAVQSMIQSDPKLCGALR